MRHLGQAFLLLTFAAVVIFLFGWRDAQPAPLQSLSSTMPQKGLRETQKKDLAVNMPPFSVFDQQQEAVPLDPRENDLLYRPPLDVAFIFTHAQDNWPLQVKLLFSSLDVRDSILMTKDENLPVLKKRQLNFKNSMSI